MKNYNSTKPIYSYFRKTYNGKDGCQTAKNTIFWLSVSKADVLT